MHRLRRAWNAYPDKIVNRLVRVQFPQFRLFYQFRDDAPNGHTPPLYEGVEQLCLAGCGARREGVVDAVSVSRARLPQAQLFPLYPWYPATLKGEWSIALGICENE